jgi:hypothetical protein
LSTLGFRHDGFARAADAGIDDYYESGSRWVVGCGSVEKACAVEMEKGVTWCVRSTMRTSGMMEYITPRQIATESSTVPKSVMKTMVGGYFADCEAEIAEAQMSKASNVRQAN